MHLLPYFQDGAIQRSHSNFSFDDPCCDGNELRDKTDYNYMYKYIYIYTHTHIYIHIY